MKQIILIRHGSLACKYNGCYIGSLDVPLSAKGLEDAAAIGKYIADIHCEHIFASPMLRVKQTLETALPPGKIKKVEYDERLREINFGDWEEKKFPEISKQYPDEVKGWTGGAAEFRFPHGARLEDFYHGIEEFKKTLLNSSGSTLMVFTHGGVILALICSVLGLGKEKMLGFKVNRGSISSLELFENGYGTLTALNIKPGDIFWTG